MSDTDIYKNRERMPYGDKRPRRSTRRRRSDSQRAFDDHTRKRRSRNSGLRRLLHLYRKKESEKVIWLSVLTVAVVVLVLLAIWLLIPILLWLNPDFFGLLDEQLVEQGLLHTTAVLWLFTGIGAVMFRTVQLFFIMGFQSGLVWASKIITDPFHDIKIYHKAPGHLIKGEMYDDMSDWYREVPADSH